jgi:hypothetical protein
LELAELWAVLVNSGHLFGTFATERGFLYQLSQQRDHAEYFVAKIDERLRGFAEEVVRVGDIYRSSYAVAAWECSRLPAGAVREVCIEALRLYRGDESPSIEKVRWAFRRARQFSYLQLHAPLGVGLAQGVGLQER